MRTMILLSALPGSGKSTWARAYGESHKNTFIVSSDEIRLEYFGAPNDFRDEAFVWRKYLERLNTLGREFDECTIIADATNLTNHYRRFYFENTPDFDRHILVYFDIPFETCMKQNKMRNGERVVPDYAMEKLRKELELPDQETIALYDEYLVINNVNPAHKGK